MQSECPMHRDTYAPGR